MEIVWDEPKRAANRVKHGLDFAELSPAFFRQAVFRPGHSRRWLAIGLQGDAAIVVVFKPLGVEGVSIISMRIASRYERQVLND